MRRNFLRSIDGANYGDEDYEDDDDDDDGEFEEVVVAPPTPADELPAKRAKLESPPPEDSDEEVDFEDV